MRNPLPRSRHLLPLETFIFTTLFLVGSGCASFEEEPAPGVSAIVFDAKANLHYRCGEGLDAWTVTDRDTGAAEAAGCEQAVIFEGASPNTHTFDIEGFSGTRRCWTGTCQVRGTAGETVHADCRASITPLCGF